MVEKCGLILRSTSGLGSIKASLWKCGWSFIQRYIHTNPRQTIEPCKNASSTGLPMFMFNMDSWFPDILSETKKEGYDKFM